MTDKPKRARLTLILDGMIVSVGCVVRISYVKQSIRSVTLRERGQAME